MLHGLMRVRHFTQDDGHIFCTEEQVQAEVARMPWLRSSAYAAVRLRGAAGALHPPRDSGSAATRCGIAPRPATPALGDGGLRYELNPGDGAFYGPEDRPAHDRLAGRSWQLGTVPARLLDARALRSDLHRGRQRRASPGDDPPRADGVLRALHRHPHRALRRRAAGVARAPCRRSCCPSPTASTTTPQRVEQLRSHDARAELDDRSESVARKIRDADCARSPTCSIVGEREAERRLHRPSRARRRERSGACPLAEFLERGPGQL